MAVGAWVICMPCKALHTYTCNCTNARFAASHFDAVRKARAGVLRSLVRLHQAGNLPQPEAAPAAASLQARADSLGVAHSHPTWLVERWLQRWGDAETIALMAANNRREHQQMPC